jgi:plastocyanin
LAQGAAEQRVELSSFDFTPRELHLRAGQRVALVLTNVASGGHDFAAPAFFAAARVDPADAALVAHGEVDVPGKSTRTIHLVPAAGSYKLTCTHTMHALLGMKGRIVVE